MQCIARQAAGGHTLINWLVKTQSVGKNMQAFACALHEDWLVQVKPLQFHDSGVISPLSIGNLSLLRCI
jgi:hypothetical protein